MNPFATMALGFSLVMLVLLSAVTLHVVYLRWSKGRGSAVVLGGLLLAGGSWLWGLLAAIPLTLRIGAVFLYIGGCIVYLELRSLLSRGYSLRILVDLLGHGEGLPLGTLQSGYGNGVGMRGMLRRRVATLARWHLVASAEEQVGPLTRVGVLCAVITSGMRWGLRMERVG